MHEVQFLVGLFAWFDVADHFFIKNLLDCFFNLLEKDLWNPPTQGVDGVQELGLDGIEE